MDVNNQYHVLDPLTPREIAPYQSDGRSVVLSSGFGKGEQLCEGDERKLLKSDQLEEAEINCYISA
jgi:hypothetical protein